MDRNPHRASCTRRTLLRGAIATAAGGLVGIELLPHMSPSTAFADPAVSSLPHDPAGAPVKTASTFYTKAKVDAARHNVATYGWASRLREAAVDAAKPYVDAADEWLWQQVPTQGLPRSYAVNQALGSPITGRGIYKYGNYPWIIDHLANPWKMVDPSVPEGSGEPRIYPTNDFGAFYRSGLNERGEFDRALADESLLVNELYPERGPSWGVDDGFGWVDDGGNKWTFVAYYNHWAMWHTGFLSTGILALRDAYLYTGDPGYARAGVILLDRVADLYPSMDTAPYKVEDGFLHSDGGSGLGRVIGRIWEAELIRNYVYAYDAFFPAIAESDTLDVVPFLSAQAAAHGLPSKESIDDVRLNVENGVLREVCKGVLSGKIGGDFGKHQHTLSAAAVVLDEPDASVAWIDYVLGTGGRFYESLIDRVDRDGSGDEGAPGYNYLWIGHVQSVADVLDGYARYPEANLYEHPKYAKMFQTNYSLAMIGRYVPAIGDTGQTGRSELHGTPSDHVAAFEQFGKPEYAQLAYLLGDGDVSKLYSDVFALDVDATQQRIADVINERGPLLLPSENLAGFGLAALRATELENQRAAWIHYGRTPQGHGHLDTLNLGLYAFGLDLLPDLGYPEFADNNARRFEWTGNTIAHNTVVVDEAPQARQWVAQPQGFGATDRVQFADISAPDVYPQVSLYRRAVAQIRVDEVNSYLVDTFRIVGGHDHHFSFHAAEGSVRAEGLTLVEQEGAAARIAYPWRTPSKAGDYGALSQEISVDPAASHELSVRVRDDFAAGTAGYHFIQVLLDDVVVAERDVAGADDWTELTADVTGALADKTTATLTLRLYEKRGVGHFGVAVLFDDVSISGTTIENGDFEDPESTAWQPDSSSEHFTVQARVGGSYAGPGIAPPPASGPRRPGANGFDWLSNVARDQSPPAEYSLDWSVVDTYGVHESDQDVHVRLHAFHHADDVALADGKPPRNKPGNPESLRYQISHRSGVDLASQFVSVIEPYRAQPYIRSVVEVPVEGVNGDVAPHEVSAVKVELADGRVDYVVSSVRTDVQMRIDGVFNFRGSFGVYSVRDGNPEYAFGHNTTMVGPAPQMAGPPEVVGTLRDFTRELSSENQLTIELPEEGPKPGKLVGEYAYVLGTDPVRARITYPWRTPSTAGTYGALSQQITVHEAASHQLSAQVHDDFDAGTAGYHFIQVLLDGEVVAEDDVAGTPGWRELTADVTEKLAGKNTATLTLRLFEKKAVNHFGVTVLFDDVRITGTTIENADFEDQNSAAWNVETTSPAFGVDPSYAGESGEVRNAVYPIVAATATDDTNTKLVLDIGDITTIRRYVDPENLEAGYRYNIAEGATVIVPITREWSPS